MRKQAQTCGRVRNLYRAESPEFSHLNGSARKQAEASGPADPDIYNVRPGGWVAGPKIRGKLSSPTADWLRMLPSGVSRFDARGAIDTDDGELIYFSFGGVVHFEEQAAHRLCKGEVLKADDCYSITTPTFQTGSQKYFWLNRVQAIGKLIEVKAGEDGYVAYDIFIIR
jgi:hypothetical protein